MLPVFLTAALLLTLQTFGSSTAKEARINDLVAETDGAQLLLSFELLHAFDDDLLRRIESGLPTELAYDVRLLRRRAWWFDGVVSAGRLRLTAIYDSVTREYQLNVERDDELIESRVVRDADELRDAMTRFDRLALFAHEPSRERLRVRVRAELGTRTRLFFIPTTHTTEWAETKDIRAFDPTTADSEPPV